MRDFRRSGSLLLIALALAACAPTHRAVVVERSLPQQRAPATPVASIREHVVAGGDTLYGIAFRHGLDVRQLAAWNGIGPPYRIYPGQRLRLQAPPRAVARPPARPTPGASTSPRTAPVRAGEPVRIAPLAETPPARRASPASPNPPPPPAGATPPPSRGVAATPEPPSAQPAPSVPPPPPTVERAAAPTAATAPIAAAPTRRVGGVAWRWPAAGRVHNRFVAGDPSRQGIDILGSPGAPVLAAADGEVVYSGNGLIGYGELIIVKHSAEFLSAYGHNRRRLVAEGERVRAGQQIAEMGRSGGALDLLHFEIRRGGRPADPLGFLPPR